MQPDDDEGESSIRPRRGTGSRPAAARRFQALRHLAADAPIELTVTGRCMQPELPEGSRIWVERCRFYWPGDVVAFHSRRGELLLHRVIGYWPSRGGLGLLTQADAADRPDAPVARHEVLGRRVDGPSSPRRRVGFLQRLRALSRFLLQIGRAVRR